MVEEFNLQQTWEGIELRLQTIESSTMLLYSFASPTQPATKESARIMQLDREIHNQV